MFTLAAIAMVAMTPAARPAAAQDTQTRYYTVTTDQTPMLCGASSVYYAVARLAAGTVLESDQATRAWARVAYLPGMRALAPVRDARISATNEEGDPIEVQLARPSRLKAIEPFSPGRQYWYLVDPEDQLPAGRKLQVLDVVLRPNNEVAGYLVAPPPEARGYVSIDALRPATAEEIAAFRGEAPSDTPEPEPAPADDEGADDGQAPAEDDTTPPPAGDDGAGADDAATDDAAADADDQANEASPPGEEDSTSTGGGGDPASDESTGTGGHGEAGDDAEQAQPEQDGADPVEPSEDEQADPVDPAGGDEVGNGEADPNAAAETDANEAEADETPKAPPVLDAAALIALYQQVQAQPLAQAELDAAIIEFERTVASMEGDEPQAQTRRALQQRVQLLKVRQQLQASYRRFDQRGDQLGAESERVVDRAADVQRDRVYEVVGRLSTSTVYNGRRLPLLYRVQSVDTAFPRTIGYVRPNEAFDLTSKLGRIVGVAGKARLDPALRAKIIQATAVDVLEAESEPNLGG